MGTAKFLYWLGIAVIIVEVVSNFYTFNVIPAQPGNIITIRNFSLVASAFFQGGTLIGLAKIIERLQKK